jgi:dUTP pyrophosphatase
MIRKKIKYLRHNKEYELKSFGNWIDLAASKEYNLQPNEFKIIDLGISMQLPKHYEANIVPRSSTFKNFGILQTNSMGIIDTEYCGHNDRWGFPALASKKHAYIGKNDRICQFRINLSMSAPWWAKIAYLFIRYEFEEVHVLHGKNRGGFGSTGVK